MIMNIDYIRNLIDRFMDGETSLKEEKTLYHFFNNCDVPEELLQYREMFCDFNAVAFDDAETKHKARKFNIFWRVATAVAAVVLFVVSIGIMRNIHAEKQFASYHEGSYMIVKGERIDDPSKIKDNVIKTLGDADRIEKKVAENNTVTDAEQELLQSINDPDERKRMSDILNE